MKIIFGTNSDSNFRMEVNYQDYKEWEEILGKRATEHTTLVEDGPLGRRYWKTLYFKVGLTNIRVVGPIMTDKE